MGREVHVTCSLAGEIKRARRLITDRNRGTRLLQSVADGLQDPSFLSGDPDIVRDEDLLPADYYLHRLV